MKSKEKSFFKGAIIGGVGALVIGEGIALLMEAIEETILMVTSHGYSAAGAILHTFGDSFALILIAAGAWKLRGGGKQYGHPPGSCRSRCR